MSIEASNNEEFAKLLIRVRDIATGAAGYEYHQGAQDVSSFLLRFVAALQVRFVKNDRRENGDIVLSGNGHLFQPWFRQFLTAESATEFLFENGVRAE